ncbi:unnamed protein product [Adineta steineri]|uniref:Ketosynthase family 3 (KS3) domain-containing protein n=1 Tax=Adineta steineri TaxID=433720 RepID=A0A815T8M8_9BILA|nr:unnamed protein product [Adineta steineri]CAF1501534.1 unnamed protein product [Adineta steineri]
MIKPSTVTTNVMNLSTVTTKTTNMIKSSTVTAETATHKSKTTVDNPTTQVQSKPKYNKWKEYGITVAGGHGYGDQLHQLTYSFGICVDDNKAILIADIHNHRIVEWKYNSGSVQIVAGGNGKGNRDDQLDTPIDAIVDKEKNAIIVCDSWNFRVVRWFRQSQTNPQILTSDIYCGGVAIDKDGSIYVSDQTKSEVRQWKEGDTDETLVAGGNGNGNRRDQLYSPYHIFVDEDYSLYVADQLNYRVMKWTKDAKEGIIVAGGNGRGDGLNQLTEPTGVIVNNLSQIIIADTSNNRIIQWYEGDAQDAKAGSVDPCHRLLMLKFVHLLDDAGYSVEKVNGTKTSVRIGQFSTDHAVTAARMRPEHRSRFHGPNSLLYNASTRLSYHFNLHGPNVSLDVACSSSLEALHMGVQCLRTNEADMAVCGGVNGIFAPENFLQSSLISAQSPDGRSRSFSADANGYAKGKNFN